MSRVIAPALAVVLSGIGNGCFYGVADLASPKSGDGGPDGSSAGDADAACETMDACDYRWRCGDPALAPRVFVGGQTGPYAVIGSDGALFWSDRDAMTPGAGRIRRREISGGMAVDLATNQAMPGLLAIDTSYVYWASPSTGVARVPRQGGSIDVISSDASGATGIAVDDGNVYWVSPKNPHLWSSAKDAPRTPQMLATSEPQPAMLAADATNLFWTTGSGFVETLPKGGGTPRELVTPAQLMTLFAMTGLSGAEAAGIAVDASFVYFLARGLRTAPASNTTGRLVRVRKDGSDLTLMVEHNAGAIAQLWLDGDSLYYTTGQNGGIGGQVWRVGTDGTGLVLMNCQAEAWPSGITTLGANAYWTDLKGATVSWAPL